MKAKRRAKLWFGYLEAGKSSSPVVRDDSLDTVFPGTIYLFNMNRDRILEYRQDIVELKLRELSAEEEEALTPDLKAAFKRVRADFTPRGALGSPLPVRPARTTLVSDVPDLDDEVYWPKVDDDGEDFQPVVGLQ